MSKINQDKKCIEALEAGPWDPDNIVSFVTMSRNRMAKYIRLAEQVRDALPDVDPLFRSTILLRDAYEDLEK